jgi:hypothetical protein
MSYLTSEYDLHDKIYFNENAPDGCASCDRTDAVLFDITTEDDQHLRMCGECCDEERRIERLADELAAMPSCDTRAMIIDLGETTRALVNQLQAHDMSCAACASTRKTVQSDRLHVNPAAVCCEGVA